MGNRAREIWPVPQLGPGALCQTTRAVAQLTIEQKAPELHKKIESIAYQRILIKSNDDVDFFLYLKHKGATFFLLLFIHENKPCPAF